ncbi:YfbM family protein [Oerskovia jenensis]|uniref:DUF1877 family protein n=1 Tax=Oerskovia jenensis TaxID=162169 RepID=A0ABS2LF42_9CELL|nr:YfbM family protein [Oerskovia jenensis]MBM7478759.1 hypothetical protein [Oerskovia jenensis]
MSMIGYALTLSPADLVRAAADPDWALELVEELEGSDDETRPGPRVLDLDKAWAAVAFALGRVRFPVDVIHGEQPLTEDEWGYGPPRYLTPARVQEAAAAFAATTPKALLADVSAELLDEADVYPGGWQDDPGTVQEYVLPSLRDLTDLYADAAADGYSVVVWLG